MRARTQAIGWALTVGTALGGPAVAASAAGGPWVWPLAGPHAVSRPFDPPTTPYGPGHRGADLPGRPGQEVRAAGSGQVSYAGLLAGRGVVVVVHGELRTTYEPVTAAVRVGQQVAAGQVIGRLDAGHPGCPQACLHWGLLRGDVYLDPVRLVSRGPSVLLPVGGAFRSAGQPAPARVAAAATTAPTVQPARPADEPAFALRSGDAASAGAALAALLAGVLLLRPRPRPPHRPVTPAEVARPGGRATAAAPVQPHAVGLVDLAAERHRRRPEVA